jgi:hypothetical protein
MNARSIIVKTSALVLGLGLAVGSIVIAQQAENETTAQPPMQLPPGWTMEDMQKCMIAGTPGEQHKHLTEGVGEWDCKTTMWMAPDTEPMQSTGKTVVTSVMDGRYVKCEITGEMPGMGPYLATGFYGYDNVAKTFVSSFIDNHSTGIMNGVGELSADGKTLTWNFSYHCPLTGKPATIREVETILDGNHKTLEMFGADPKSGKEFKMMSIEMTRK